jgi:phage-related baseplate assembly protein
MQKAVNDFVDWEAARIGRDINPSKLNQMMVDAGAKRTVITNPSFTHLVDGRGVTADVPQLATVRNIVIRVGGDEDE